VDKEGVKILVTGGNHQLGGKNWDDRLIAFLATAFEAENGVNPLTDPFAHQELRIKAEIIKKTLSEKTKIPFPFAFAGCRWRTEVERAKFEEITADWFEQTIKVTHETLDALEAKTQSRKIDRFFLVGGSSRMPVVKDRIDREFGVNSEKYDPDECVAKGAALWGLKCKIDIVVAEAGVDPKTGKVDEQKVNRRIEEETKGMSNVRPIYEIRGKRIVNVSSHTYGIKAWDKATEIVVPLLAANCEIPFTFESPERMFGVAEDNQKTIELHLMEADGDSLDPEHCKEIGHGTVELPRGVPKGSEVQIWFKYAADGTMTLGARELSTNAKCEVTLTRPGVMDREEVEQSGDKLALLNAR